MSAVCWFSTDTCWWDVVRVDGDHTVPWVIALMDRSDAETELQFWRKAWPTAVFRCQVSEYRLINL